jgi:DNA-binding response OmpR family regulator
MTQKPVILVIEDEQPLAEAIQGSLEASGCETVVTRSFTQAVDYLQSLKHIDAIWLDHYLFGKENGIDFLVRLRADQRWVGTPVFVVTNTGGYDKKQAYLELGATRYFVKSDHTLREIIEAIKLAVLNQGTHD